MNRQTLNFTNEKDFPHIVSESKQGLINEKSRNLLLITQRLEELKELFTIFLEDIKEYDSRKLVLEQGEEELNKREVNLNKFDKDLSERATLINKETNYIINANVDLKKREMALEKEKRELLVK